MDYFYNVFMNFLKLQNVVELTWRDRNLSGFIKNIFYLCFEDKQSLMVWNNMRVSN